MNCFSESFESLSEGLQSALWQLGGVPKAHRTDRLSTAVHKADSPEEFTQRYRAVLKHYDIDTEATNAGSPNENGDVEQRHHRFKKALDQALLLRGNRDFASREDHAAFLKKLFAQLNAGRRERFKDELEGFQFLISRERSASIFSKPIITKKPARNSALTPWTGCSAIWWKPAHPTTSPETISIKPLISSPLCRETMSK